MRILLVDDEIDLRTAVGTGLRAEGYQVDEAADGLAALQYARLGNYDAIVLDLMLPHLSGYRVAETLRAEGVQTPVLVLTARTGDFDQTDALDSGADDYLAKPFSFPVLLARLRALIRRANTGRPVVDVGDLSLELLTRRCTRRGVEVVLTELEFQLLVLLARNAGRPVSKQEMLARLWPAQATDENLVEARIRALRRKVDEPFGVDSIETVRGAGYRLVGRRG